MNIRSICYKFCNRISFESNFQVLMMYRQDAMSKKVAVVTGSNKGIGFATVRALCSKFEGDVILTARDELRGREAVKKLEAENLYPKFHLLDITCAESITKLSFSLMDQYGGLDILINNAAVGYLPGDLTPILEQATTTTNVNVFGTINMSKEMFPLLRQHARDVKNGVQEERGWGKLPYQISKTAITALTFIQHRRFMEDPHRDIIVNAVHPGRTRTDLVKNDGCLTPDQGAVVPVYCALLPPNILEPRGQFVWCDKSIKSWI